MDAPPRSALLKDGPEYSRVSPSLDGKWYAEGHSDPDEDADDKRRRKRFQEEERQRREEAEERVREELEEMERHEREERRRADEERRVRGSGQSSDGEERVPVTNRPTGSGANGSRGATGATGGNGGNSADDEGSPPSYSAASRYPDGMVAGPQGAHYIPATSIQNPLPANPNQAGGQPSPSSLSQDWSIPIADTCPRKYGRLFTCPACFTLTACMFAFSFFCYMVLIMWLQPNLIGMIREKVVLRPGGLPSPRHNIRLEVYFYNVTHINRTGRAGGPGEIHTTEIGPYTYVVKSSKTNVTWNDANSTVSYRVKDSFHFQPNRSNGSLDDIINNVDASILTKLSQMEVKGKPFVKVSSLGENGFIQPQTVGDILWGRNQDSKKGLKGFTNKLKSFVRGIKKITSPSTRVMKESNESISKVFNVYTGDADIGRLDQMYSFNYSRANRMWPRGHNHYPMSGTANGDCFPPMMKKSQNIAMFYSQTKRNLLLQYQKTVQVRHHRAYRYVLPQDYESSPHSDARQLSTPPGTPNQTHSSSPDTPRPKVIDVDLTAQTGLPEKEAFTLQYLEKDSPIQVSFPSSHKDSQGNDSVCKMYLDVHPVSGITLRKRLCHQMYLPVSFPGDGPKDVRFILPIMWVDWFYESIPDDLEQTMTSYEMLQVVEVARVVFVSLLLVFGGILLIQIVIAALQHCYNRQRVPLYHRLNVLGHEIARPT